MFYYKQTRKILTSWHVPYRILENGEGIHIVPTLDKAEYQNMFTTVFKFPDPISKSFTKDFFRMFIYFFKFLD